MSNLDKVVIGAVASAVIALVLAARKVIPAVAAKLDVTSTDNVIYKNVVGSAGTVLTGDRDFTLGGWFYDVTHRDPVATAGFGDQVRVPAKAEQTPRMPAIVPGSYYDLGAKLPPVKQETGSWLGSLFKSSAEKQVDAMYGR